MAKFTSTIGKQKMIDEIREIIALFKAVDPQVDDLWLAIWSKYGFTEEKIEHELQEVKRVLNLNEKNT